MNRAEQLQELERLLKNQDWYYQMADGNAFTEGRQSMNKIWALKEQLGQDGEELYAKYYVSCWK